MCFSGFKEWKNLIQKSTPKLCLVLLVGFLSSPFFFSEIQSFLPLRIRVFQSHTCNWYLPCMSMLETQSTCQYNERMMQNQLPKVGSKKSIKLQLMGDERKKSRRAEKLKIKIFFMHSPIYNFCNNFRWTKGFAFLFYRHVWVKIQKFVIGISLLISRQ